jgi:hypothetical protein
MKRVPIFICRILPVWLLLSSCGQSGAGPQAWIDTPLNNTIAPLAKLPLMAHASDSDGVAIIEFYVNGELRVSVDAGGGRLGWAEYEGWSPPGPGEYLIGAKGIDKNGNSGALATSLVIVSGEELAVPVEDKIPAETEPPEAEPPVAEPPPAETETPVVIAKLDANCREGPSAVYEIYGNLLEGEQAPIKGRNPDTSWLLIALPGRSNACWIARSTVDFQGSLDGIAVAAAPPPAGTEPPIGDVIEPEPVEVDNEPPVYYQVGAEPSSIMVNGVSCSGYENTTMVYAVIVEDSGLSSVAAHWNVGSASGVAPMSEGWLGYYTYVGPVNTAGSMSVYFTAVDIYGNIGASDTIYVTVYDNCIK